MSGSAPFAAEEKEGSAKLTCLAVLREDALIVSASDVVSGPRRLYLKRGPSVKEGGFAARVGSEPVFACASLLLSRTYLGCAFERFQAMASPLRRCVALPPPSYTLPLSLARSTLMPLSHTPTSKPPHAGGTQGRKQPPFCLPRPSPESDHRWARSRR